MSFLTHNIITSLFTLLGISMFLLLILDPIINNVCLSDHIHSFYGPPLVDPSVDTEDLLKTDPSEHSGLVEENKSLYWHPSIYKVSADGVYTLDEVYYVSVYYF